MDTISEILTRGIANIIPSKSELEKILRSDRKLNIYLGIDPTATHIHLGHAVPLRKLQQFVELDHHVTFLIGDFTTLIGDTSDKDSERPRLSRSQIEENFKTYRHQAEKILDFSKVNIRHNSEWLSQLNAADFIDLAYHFSLNDFISRELIKKRLDSGGSIKLPEVLYPLLQGYDSLKLDTDIQIGGTDQTFNMQAGRTLIKDIKNKDSFVMTNVFLTGTDGRKMSKSWGNAIWLDDTPNDIYGKVMSLKDDLIDQYFLLATNLSESQIQDLKSNISHPMDLKKLLAKQIVEELWGPAPSEAAQEEFESVFQKGSTPSDVPSFVPQSHNIIEVLVDSGLVSSKSEARRLIDQKGVRDNSQVVSTPDHTVQSDSTISIGSRKFVKIK